MIGACIINDKAWEALLLFVKMKKSGAREDGSSFASALSACNSLGILEHGTQMHAHACKFGAIDDLIVGTALVDTYAKCGRSDSAYELFSALGTCDNFA